MLNPPDLAADQMFGVVLVTFLISDDPIIPMITICRLIMEQLMSQMSRVMPIMTLLQLGLLRRLSAATICPQTSKTESRL